MNNSSKHQIKFIFNCSLGLREPELPLLHKALLVVSHFDTSIQKTSLTISTAFTAFIATLSFGQTTEGLNKKSKELLEKQDFKNAVPLIKQAAENGHAEAQYNYGICYQQGVKVTQSDSIANTRFLKAAN